MGFVRWSGRTRCQYPETVSRSRGRGLYGAADPDAAFGRTAKVGYNPDSFGHPGSLPQILKLEGMEDDVFMRPGVNEKQLPGNLFWWKGIDGIAGLKLSHLNLLQR